MLGGSIAGLFAARVLSDYADEVLIIERDTADGANPRPGVPQGGQVHALLPGGRIQLDRWFPDFSPEAVAAGAVEVSMNATMRMYMGDRPRSAIPRRADGQDVTLLMTRPRLEYLLRRRVEQLPNVSTIHGRATGIHIEAGRVTGVTYEPAGAVVGELRVGADFVVDAMGRGSRLTEWLTAAGVPVPKLERIPIKTNYVTTVIQAANPDALPPFVGFHGAPQGAATGLDGAVILTENGKRMVVLAGYDTDRPTRDLADLRDRATRAYPPPFAEALQDGSVIGEPVSYHLADSRRRDFDTVAEHPARLVSLGDAVSSFNPVYGQGMTSAALQASALAAYLQAGPDLDRPALEYFRSVRTVVDAAWQPLRIADMAQPHLAHLRPRHYPMLARFGNLMLTASQRSVKVRQQLDEVSWLIAHPDQLSRPSFVLSVLTNGLRREPADSKSQN
ncbi:NAD(P)/FAD-dependent oxidoreductase [Paractinoplanes toevensis]|uniref:NAD(P)/FAD-dependent oxidoreductase n=1 Tax=Paractinoplanes toevensis TaxID=571911 RepID=UPI001BB34B78|nr:FAD-dependent monooxygenase [Actinoplanes toevensis]